MDLTKKCEKKEKREREIINISKDLAELSLFVHYKLISFHQSW